MLLNGQRKKINFYQHGPPNQLTKTQNKQSRNRQTEEKQSIEYRLAETEAASMGTWGMHGSTSGSL